MESELKCHDVEVEFRLYFEYDKSYVLDLGF